MQIQCLFFLISGAQSGTIIALPISGILADTVNWESVFYFFGALGVVWFVFWMFLVYDTPGKHPRISTEEREYIEATITSKDQGAKLPLPPWKHIMTSIPMISLIIAHCGHNYGFYTLLTMVPTYLYNIQHFDLATVSSID